LPLGDGLDALAIAALPTLEAVAQAIGACTRCGLCRSAIQAVPGEGGARAEFLCIGEAPGADEDRAGRPFVGAAGEVLRKGLAGLKMTPDEYFIANVLKHRPPGNRDPEPAEVEACAPFLRRQVELIRPRVILALGRFAAQTLLQSSAGIGALRGRVHQYQGIPLVVTYHPAATLRNDEWKRPLWEDMKLARRLLDEARAGGSPGLA
jgi:DNA polymerase